MAIEQTAHDVLAEEATRFLTSRTGQMTDPAELAEYEACFSGLPGCGEALATAGAELVCARLEPALESVNSFSDLLRGLPSISE